MLLIFCRLDPQRKRIFKGFLTKKNVLYHTTEVDFKNTKSANCSCGPCSVELVVQLKHAEWVERACIPLSDTETKKERKQSGINLKA